MPISEWWSLFQQWFVVALSPATIVVLAALSFAALIVAIILMTRAVFSR